MRNMLAFAALLVLTFAVVGGWLGWYHVRSTPAPDGKSSLTVDFDTKKIGSDISAAEEKIRQKLAERAKASADEAAAKKEQTKAPAARKSVVEPDPLKFGVKQ